MQKIIANKHEKMQIPDVLLEFALGKGADTSFWRNDFRNIRKFYSDYRKGVRFITEGTNGDYLPSNNKYKIGANIINKVSRFLFSEHCTIDIVKKNNTNVETKKEKDALMNIEEYIEEVFKENNFYEELFKSSKDAFVGKRIAIMVNVSEETGIDIVFFNSLSFVYDMDVDTNELKMFTAFKVVKDSKEKKDSRYLCKKYTKEEDGIYLEEKIFDGINNEKETVFPKEKVKLKRIPVEIVLNDGLVGEVHGESDLAKVKGYEESYSRLSNADIDAQRKTMNPVVYTVDMDSLSTKELPRSPSSYWDLSSDANHMSPKPEVGTIESTMAYSSALDTTLSRTKDAAYEELEVPNVTSEMLKGNVTTGKALKAIYWPLIVRCKEKMLSWQPAIINTVNTLIECLWLYKSIANRYTHEKITEKLDVTVFVENVFPLPEDELEEKRSDLESVQAHTMSKRTFISKWYNKSETEANEEFKKIMEEMQLESASTTVQGSGEGDGEGGAQVGQKYTYKYNYDGKKKDSEGKGNNSIKEGLNLNKKYQQREARKDNKTEEE